MDYKTSSSKSKKQKVIYFLIFFVFCAVLGTILIAPNRAFIESVVTVSATVPSSGSSSSGGGGGGGGGGGISLTTQAVFRGKAYPGSKVSLLKDGELVAEVPAGPDANFEISISGLSSGSYVFGVYSEDNRKIRSVTHTFPVLITRGITTVISGIFLPPTIAVDKSQVKRGDVITFFGTTIPDAEVKVFVHSETEIIKKVSSDSSGVWLAKLDTSDLEYGEHMAKARASTDEDISEYSDVLAFKVGNVSVLVSDDHKTPKGDINKDGRVNLVDFSIAAFWYKKRVNSESKKADINGDGVVDLKDFSIMAYYWTG